MGLIIASILITILLKQKMTAGAGGGTTVYVNHQDSADCSGILCKACTLTIPKLSISRKASMATASEMVLTVVERVKLKVMRRQKEGAAEILSTGKPASRSSKRRWKELNCSIYNMTSREFDKALEEWKFSLKQKCQCILNRPSSVLVASTVSMKSTIVPDLLYSIQAVML